MPIVRGAPIFAFGFAKSADSNISNADVVILRDAAADAIRWSNSEFDCLLISGALVEIEDGMEKE